MMGHRKWAYALVCMCLVWSSLPLTPNAGPDEIMEVEPIAGGRQLLQTKLDCPEDYNFYDFSPILDRCKNGTTEDLLKFSVKDCCQSLCTVLGSNGSYINDEKYDCADQFFTYLNLAGQYPPAFFANACTDVNSPDGIYCPPEEDATTPPPPPSASAASTVPNSIQLAVVLALAVLGVKLLLV